MLKLTLRKLILQFIIVKSSENLNIELTEFTNITEVKNELDELKNIIGGFEKINVNF